jgi:hypothetical protein
MHDRCFDNTTCVCARAKQEAKSGEASLRAELAQLQSSSSLAAQVSFVTVQSLDE